MAKNFSVSFDIHGAMDGSLAAALQNASRLMRGLGESARATSAAAKASQAGLRGLANSLGSIQQAAQQFKTLQDAVKQTAADFPSQRRHSTRRRQNISRTRKRLNNYDKNSYS